MWKRSILAGTALALALGLSVAARATERPNIILVVLDDVGFSDLGAFGSEIRTPNIDALARDGLRYNRFDTKAVCTPTRAALLTGRNPQTVRMADLPADQPDPANMTKDRGELPVHRLHQVVIAGEILTDRRLSARRRWRRERIARVWRHDARHGIFVGRCSRPGIDIVAFPRDTGFPRSEP